MTSQDASDGEITELDDVLSAFVAEHRRPSFGALCAYVQRHPRYARELIEFTVEWAVLAQAGAVRSREDERRMEEMTKEALADLHELFSPMGNPTTAAGKDKKG
jgi:hypothetical protein